VVPLSLAEKERAAPVPPGPLEKTGDVKLENPQPMQGSPASKERIRKRIIEIKNGHKHVTKGRRHNNLHKVKNDLSFGTKIPLQLGYMSFLHQDTSFRVSKLNSNLSQELGNY
jgi:hypothetical protein